jgi:hypothetical protein
MRGLLPILLLIPAVVSCGKGNDSPPEVIATNSASVSAQATPSVRTPKAPPTARHEKVSNNLIDFEFSYPVEAAAIPSLKSVLDADLIDQKSVLEARAKAGLVESRKDGWVFQPYGSWTEWKVVTDLSGWLSLSGEISSYSGGAHPDHGFDAMLWDKFTSRRRKPIDLFISRPMLSSVIRDEFCRQIDKQREVKRGEPVDRANKEPFNDCIDPADSTIILGSTNQRTFDRIGVLVAPYEAGAYAEGSYEVTLPVTKEVLRAVKPQFLSSFSEQR